MRDLPADSRTIRLCREFVKLVQIFEMLCVDAERRYGIDLQDLRNDLARVKYSASELIE